MGGISIFLVLFLIKIPPTFGNPTVQCAQTGAFPFGGWYDTWNCHDPGEAVSIGVEKLTGKYCGSMFSAWITINNQNIRLEDLYAKGHDECPYKWNPKSIRRIQLCDEEDKLVKMRVYSVHQKDSNGTTHVLSGWLHIEVELVDQTGDEIRLIYAQVNDESFNSIGEFVSNPAEQFNSSNPKILTTPSRFEYIPCNAIGAREPKPSQALYMSARLDRYSDWEDPDLKPPYQNFYHGVHFTWRLSEYWCNRHIRFRPEVYVLTTKNINGWRIQSKEGQISGNSTAYGNHYLYRKIPNMWFRAEWFGAADIKHPGRGQLQCDKLVIDEKTKEVKTKEVPWMKEKKKNVVEDDYYHKNRLTLVGNIWEIISCQPPLIQGYTRAENFPKFAGRCYQNVSKVRPDTGSGYHHTCNLNTSAPQFNGLNFTKYTNYTFDLTAKRKKSCKNPCRSPETVEDAIAISNLVGTGKKKGTNVTTIGIAQKHRSKLSVEKFWKGRKFHGALGLVVTMFLMPVSNFMARYYKETFMNSQYHGVHIWFWVHSGASVGSLALLVCGQIALGEGIRSWGRSQSFYSIAHHSIGWSSIFVFIFMVILGKLRNAKKKWLKVLMVAHAVVGFTLYVLNIIQIGLSIYIPASPSLRRCGKDGLPTGISPTMYIAMGWAGLDLVFHGFLTALQMTADRTLMGIMRPMYFPILPVLSPHSHVDMKRSGLRRLVLLFYIILSASFTLVATFHLVMRFEPEGCTVGEMSCKAALGCTPVALAMCKKLKYDICTRRGRRVI